MAQRGFTLIELLVTLTVAAILSVVALPAMREVIITQRLKSSSFDLQSALIYGRSEAIKRNGNVSVVQAGSSWQDGWNVVAGTTTLRRQGALADVAVVPSSTEGKVTFRRDGRLDESSGNMPSPSFVLSLSESARIPARCISITSAGRVNLRMDTNADADDGCN